ncbi:MAG TPA: flavin reductase family protein [Candidatus Acidoferrales bacterium]|nr:flavin reductase family protein [Candidatus Acidoferrales bacterium]
MSHFATGVTVVTARDEEGQNFGITANAFTSVSLDPPLVLVCIDKSAQCYSCFEETKTFAVNILSERQQDISRRFATKGIDKFEGLSWRAGASGVPLIDGAVGHVECRIVERYEGGDHTIYLAEVISGEARDGAPLLFFRSKYHRLGSAL